MKILSNDLPDDVVSLKALLLEQAILLDIKDAELTQWQTKYQLILEQ
jgi:transposase